MKERERRKIISDSIIQLRNVIPLSFNGDKLNQVSTMTLAIKYIKFLQDRIMELESGRLFVSYTIDFFQVKDSRLANPKNLFHLLQLCRQWVTRTGKVKVECTLCLPLTGWPSQWVLLTLPAVLNPP